jgi:hypothetical protein
MPDRDDRHYVPILRAKRAELAALATSRHLSAMTPLLELQSVEGDVVSTVIHKRMGGIVQAWQDAMFLDIQGAFDDADVDVAEGYDLARRAFRAVCEEFEVALDEPIPVIDLSSPDQFLAAVRGALGEAGGPNEVCLRLRADQLGRPLQLRQAVDGLLARLNIGHDGVHLVLDFGADINVSFAEMAIIVIGDVPWGGFTLGWGAFPSQLGPNEEQVHGRQDWTGWVEVHDALTSEGSRAPGFGDYSVVAAQPPPSVPRAPNPNLRVTRDLDWLVVRERRNPLEGNEGIYRVAERLVRGEHVDEALSEGDRWITEHARGQGTTGNAATWIRVGHQRHFAFVTRQLASRPAP